MLYQTDRVVCREFRLEDLKTFAAYRALPKVARFQSWTEFTYDDALALFETMNQVAFATIGHWFQLALVEKGTNQMIGDLAVHFVDDHQVEIGFTLDPQFQGKGFAREAVLGLLEFLFGKLALHRVTATTDTENIPSWRLLERVGFRREGHFKENIFFKGTWGSEFQYAMLASEWEK